MKTKITTLILVFASTVFATLPGCEKEREDNELLISSFGEDESHHRTENCMNCHYSEGNADGWFTVAGTALGGNQITVELFDHAMRPIKVLEVDDIYNFYTTESVDFSGGLRVGVRNQNGTIEMMEDKIYYGACNQCHGHTTSTISVD